MHHMNGDVKRALDAKELQSCLIQGHNYHTQSSTADPYSEDNAAYALPTTEGSYVVGITVVSGQTGDMALSDPQARFFW